MALLTAFNRTNAKDEVAGQNWATADIAVIQGIATTFTPAATIFQDWVKH
jgi:hypothetical protein